MESLFVHLVSQGLISPDILSRAAPSQRQRLSGSEIRDLANRVLDRVRGNSSEADLWATWRFFTRPLKSSVWLTGMVARPELNGARASITSFEADAELVVVQLSGSLEALHLSGRNLAWCPPDPTDVSTTVALLAKVIDTEAAAAVSRYLFCGRCERPCEIDERCVVPHPPSRRLDLIGNVRWVPGRLVYYLCRACGGLQWRKAGRLRGDWEAMESAAPCWEGKHTMTRLTSTDGRRFYARHPKLINSHYLLDDIDALTDTTLSLRISDKSAKDVYEVPRPDSSAVAGKHSIVVESLPRQPSLRETLPNLEELYLEDVALHIGHSGLNVTMSMNRVEVSDELFPNLKVLSLVSMDPGCNYTFNTSSLKVLHIRSQKYRREITAGNLMTIIAGSTSLEELHAPGLSVGDFSVLSNSLSHIDFRNASHLGTLTLWAPNLKVLNVQSCGLEKVVCLTDHHLKNVLPPDHVQPPLLVRNGSSNIDATRIDHPNVTFSAEIIDDK